MARSKSAQQAFECLGMLRSGRAFERRNFEFLQTLEDRDLLCEIGYRQHIAPLTVKEVLLLGFGSIATVQRRLRRLREMGAIQARRSTHDGRAMELVLSPRVLRIFEQYAELLTSRP